MCLNSYILDYRPTYRHIISYHRLSYGKCMHGQNLVIILIVLINNYKHNVRICHDKWKKYTRDH